MATETTKPDVNERNASAWLLLHCFFGPAIGTVVVALTTLVNEGPITAYGTAAQWNLNDYAMIPAILLVGLFPGWFFGFLPALLHAIAMLLLRRIIPSRKVWMALTPLIGWLATFLPLLAFSGAQTPEKIIDSAFIALVGAIAASGCMAIAWRRRIYPL